MQTVLYLSWSAVAGGRQSYRSESRTGVEAASRPRPDGAATHGAADRQVSVPPLTRSVVWLPTWSAISGAPPGHPSPSAATGWPIFHFIRQGLLLLPRNTHIPQSSPPPALARSQRRSFQRAIRFPCSARVRTRHPADGAVLPAPPPVIEMGASDGRRSAVFIQRWLSRPAAQGSGPAHPSDLSAGVPVTWPLAWRLGVGEGPRPARRGAQTTPENPTRQRCRCAVSVVAQSAVLSAVVSWLLNCENSADLGAFRGVTGLRRVRSDVALRVVQARCLPEPPATRTQNTHHLRCTSA